MLNRINKLLENQYFPITLRIITFISFIVLVIIGFSARDMGLPFLRQLSRTNLTTSFVWRLWWPLIVLSAIFLGRIWCTICPVEMITAFFARIGLKRNRPGWILSGWVITVFYAVIVIAGITIIEIDRVPKYTSLYLLIIIGISVISGFIFEKNTFCRYICPVGYLLGIFSKFSLWGWRIKKQSVCKTCPDKSCVKNNYTYYFNYKSCGVDLVPASINENKDCILCSGCMKTCKAYRTENNSSRPNPALVKIGFANDLIKVKPLQIAEWVFLYFLSAHLIDELIEYKLVSDLSAAIFPAKMLNFSGMNPGLVKNATGSGFLFILFPLILWITPYVLLISARIRISFRNYLKNFSLLFLPAITGLFIGLIIMEITIKLPYYKFIIHDIAGVDTIRQIITRQIIINPLPDWVEWGMFLSMIAGSILGILVSYKLIRRLMIRFRIQKNRLSLLKALPVVFVIIFFTEVLLFKCFNISRILY